MADAFSLLGNAPITDDTNYLTDEIQFDIDSNLRTIAIPTAGVVIGVTGDKNVNRVNFRMPAWYNGFDMSKFSPRINFIDPEGNVNYYTVTDMTVYNSDNEIVTGIPTTSDTIYFTWLVDSYATKYVGSVVFNVRFTKFNSTTNALEQAFNTTKATCTVLEGITLAGEISQDEQEDLLFHMTAELQDVTDGLELNIQQKGVATLAAIEAKGETTLESIPDDYSTLSSEVSDVKSDLNEKYTSVNFRLWRNGGFVTDYATLAKTEFMYLEKGTHLYLLNKSNTTYQFMLQKFDESLKDYSLKIGEVAWSKDCVIEQSGWYVILGNRSTGEQFASCSALNNNLRIVTTSTIGGNAVKYEKAKFLKDTIWSGTSGQKLFKSFGRFSSDRFYKITADKFYVVSTHNVKLVIFDSNFSRVGDSGTGYAKSYQINRSSYTNATYFVINGPEETDVDLNTVTTVLGDGVEVPEITNGIVTVSTKDDAEFVIKGSDARPALQQALWLAYARGCKVVLDEGDYVLNSVYNYGAQVLGDKTCLMINQVESTSQYVNKAKYNTIEGAVQPLGYSSGVRIKLGETLYSSLGADEKLSIIRSAYKEDFDVKKGTSAIALRNLIFTIPMNDKQITCVDLSYTHACDIDSIQCMAGEPSLEWGAYNPPPIANANCIGIRGLLGSNWNVENTFRNIEVFGFYIGFDISGEHCSVINASAKFNYYGFTFDHLQRFGANHHPIVCINMLDEHSVCMPIFGRNGVEINQGVIIHGYNLMFPSWSTQGDIEATDERHHKSVELGSTNGNGFGGEIWYTNNTTTDGSINVNQPYPAFFESGGKGIKCVNMAHKQRYSSAGRATIEPNFMEQVFDSTLNKLVIWNGTKWVDTNGNEVD